MPRVIGGRYGLGSKNFNPAQVKAVFDELAKPDPRHGFTVGIEDDVSHTNLALDPTFSIERDDVVRALFFGLGADGTVGANKNSVKIIAEDAGDVRAGLLRLRLAQVRRPDGLAPALRHAADPRAVPDRIRPTSSPATSSSFLGRIDVLRQAAPGATFLLNIPYGPDEVWDQLPRSVQTQILAKKLRFYVIDASQGRPRGRAWATGSTPCCRPASSPSPVCCRASRRSRASSTPSRRATATRAATSCAGTSRSSTTRWRTCTRCVFRTRRRAAWSICRWCPTRRRRSCAR